MPYIKDGSKKVPFSETFTPTILATCSEDDGNFRLKFYHVNKRKVLVLDRQKRAHVSYT